MGKGRGYWNPGDIDELRYGPKAPKEWPGDTASQEYPASKADHKEAVKRPILKSIFDISVSLLGTILSLPLWLLIGLTIKMEDGGSIFYKQERVGKGLELFTIYKFRSMVANAERDTGPVWASENDHRVTRVGRVLRATAMDELPQLLSILKGDMSFVGPKPLRSFFVQKFAQEVPNYLSRFSITPGLTGMAQIYAKYDSSAHQKLRFDLLYLENGSFFFDLKIILLSFWITFRRRWEYRGRKIKGIKIGRFRIT